MWTFLQCHLLPLEHDGTDETMERLRTQFDPLGVVGSGKSDRLDPGSSVLS